MSEYPTGITHADWCPYETRTEYRCLRCHVDAARREAGYTRSPFTAAEVARAEATWRERNPAPPAFRLTPG